MKPTQAPSFGQLLIHDISSQRFGIFSLLLGVPSFGLLTYGLLGKLHPYSLIGLVGLLATLFEITRPIQRFRFFRKIYESGETVRMRISNTRKTGDEITINGRYEYKHKNHRFSTIVQKTRRTTSLRRGDQIFLVIDGDHPENAYIQDLFTPDSPDEIRQFMTLLPESDAQQQQILIDEEDVETEEQPNELPKYVQPLTLPKECQVEESDQRLKIIFLKRGWVYLIWVLFGVPFTLIGIVVVSELVKIPFSFLLPLLIGIAISYSGLVKLVNHTEIIVTPDTLKILSSPLPTPIKGHLLTAHRFCNLK